MTMQSAAGVDPFEVPRLCGYFSEHSPQPMVAVEGPTHAVRYLNAAFARLAGKTAADLRGRPFAEAIGHGEGAECLPLLDRVFRTGMPENLAEQEHCQAPPTYWSYAAWAILGADERPAGVMIQVTDATEVALFRRQAVAMNEALVVSAVRQHELIDTIRDGEEARRELEAQMFQAQKLESLGVLAGGIAHDLNNLLTPVLGYTELAANVLPARSPAVGMLEKVTQHAHRAANLVQQILACAGKGLFVLERIDLSALVRDMDEPLGAAVAPNARLQYDLAPALPPIEADAAQLRQVVMNLVTNASEAVAERGGAITIRTGLWDAKAATPVSAVLAAAPAREPAVFLEVTDTGCGMTPDVLERIFEPFFSTKFTGRGLGLAVVQGIAQGHHGTLQVHSVPGAGSTFRMLLPCAITIAPVPPATAPPAHWQGTGTVLIIDDEQPIRDMTVVLLEQAGLTVLAAASGLKGLEIVRADPQRIDAVLLDVTMPGMNGLEVAAALHGMRPDLPVVLMSGFSAAEVTLQAAGLGVAGFVQKPYRLADLLATVRCALGQ